VTEDEIVRRASDHAAALTAPEHVEVAIQKYAKLVGSASEGAIAR